MKRQEKLARFMVVMHLKVELIRLSPHKKEGQSLCISSIPAIAKG